MKGQAYRSLDFHVDNRFCDKTICALCSDLNIDLNLLGFKDQFTLWIDPFEVSIRYVKEKEFRHFLSHTEEALIN